MSANLQSSMTTDAHLLLKYLRRRSLVLDVAVVLATIAGMATSGAALVRKQQKKTADKGDSDRP